MAYTIHMLRQKLLRTRILLPLAALFGLLLYWRPWQPPIHIVERFNPTDGAVMVRVPAGKFRMGTSNAPEAKEEMLQKNWRALGNTLLRTLRGEAGSNEQPVHTVFLDTYWIYKNDVTVAQYRNYCKATGQQMPPAPPWGWHDDHPIVNVTWQDATDYAKWAGAALPTEAQWEKAARGTDGRIYPWGNDWDETKCSNSVDGNACGTSPVGSFPTGSSPYGCLDMVGNVWQWCADWYDEGYYKTSPTKNPSGPAIGRTRVLRGGSWDNNAPRNLRVTYRYGYSPPPNRNSDLGFRCVCAGSGP